MLLVHAVIAIASGGAAAVIAAGMGLSPLGVLSVYVVASNAGVLFSGCVAALAGRP